MTITFGHKSDVELNARLTRIEGILNALIQGEKQMKLNVQALIDSVTKLTTVDAGVLKLITTIAANQKDLAKQLADAIAANDPTALAATQKAIDDSATDINTQASALAQAVTDYTPAA